MSRRGAPLATLVVDSSRVGRALIEQRLAHVAGVRVAGSEFTIDRAMDRVAQGDIDLVLLQLTMRDGCACDFMRGLKSRSLRMPAVVVIGEQGEDASTTVRECFALGVTGFVTKPSHGADDKFADQLAGELGRLRVYRRCVGEPERAPPSNARGGMEICAVVASTGGPPALTRVLTSLENCPLPVAVVQHLPVGFVESLSVNLSRDTGREVVVAQDLMPLDERLVVLAPSGRHLEVERDGGQLRARLTNGAPEQGCKPAGNVLLRSAANATRGQMIGVCLTGMGSDGSDGMCAVAAAGGKVLVQDEVSSVVWGMPSSVIRAVPTAEVLELDELGPRVRRLTLLRRKNHANTGS